MQRSLEAAELIDERPDEHLDTSRLEPYLRAHLEGAEGPLAVRQFGGGKANLTYLLRFGDTPTPALPRKRGRGISSHASGIPSPASGGGPGWGYPGTASKFSEFVLR